MFPFLNSLLNLIEPLLVPVCFVIAWGFIIALGLTVFNTIYDVIKRSQTMHKIPCPNCNFFTNDYRLKCTIKPLIANTEEAINCQDYCSK